MSDNIDKLLNETEKDKDLEEGDSIGKMVEELTKKEWSTKGKYKSNAKPFFERYERDMKLLLIATIVFILISLPIVQKLITSFVGRDNPYTLMGANAGIFLTSCVMITSLIDDHKKS